MMASSGGTCCTPDTDICLQISSGPVVSTVSTIPVSVGGGFSLVAGAYIVDNSSYAGCAEDCAYILDFSVTWGAIICNSSYAYGATLNASGWPGYPGGLWDTTDICVWVNDGNTPGSDYLECDGFYDIDPGIGYDANGGCSITDSGGNSYLNISCIATYGSYTTSPGAGFRLQLESCYNG